MARQRTVKPEYFDDEDLGTMCCRDARLLGLGLLGQADREGRLKDKPGRLRVRLFPWDEDVTTADVDRWLNELQTAGYLVRYEVAGQRLIWIRRFRAHQHPHQAEQASVLPPYPSDTPSTPSEDAPTTDAAPTLHDASTVHGQCEHGARSVQGRCEHDPSTDPAPTLQGGVRSTEYGVRSTEYGVRSTETGAETDTVPRARETAPTALSVPPSADLGDRARVFLQQTYPDLYRTWRKGAHYRAREARVFPATLQLLADYPDDAWLSAMVQLWLRTDLRFAQEGDRGIEQFLSRVSWCDATLREAGFSPEHRPTDAEIGAAAHVAPTVGARASPKAVRREEDLKRGAAWAQAGA